MQNTTKKKVRKKNMKNEEKYRSWCNNLTKKSKTTLSKTTLCVSNYFSMGNFTKNRSWKQKSIELFFTDMVSLITKILPEFSCCQNSKFDFSGWFRKLINTKKNIVNFGIGKIMLWTAQIPSMCSSPNIIVNKKKIKIKKPIYQNNPKQN